MRPGHLILLAIAAAGATGCSDIYERSCERGQFVTVGMGNSGSTVMYPGDRTDAWASLAKGNEYEPACATLVYATWTGSTAFQWTSRNPAVASIVSGTLTAKSVGNAWIIGTTAGLSDSLEVLVAPRIATLGLVAVPARARSGDTVVVTVQPLDSAGNIVANARLYGPIIVSPSPYPAWVPPGFTSLSGRFVMPAAPTIIRAFASHFRTEIRAEVIVTPP